MRNIALLIALTLVLLSCSKKEEQIQTDQVTAKSLEAESIKCDHNHPYGELCINPVASKVASFSMEGKYDEAIKVLVEAKDVPGYQWDKGKIYESLIYLYDKTKQYDKNIGIWSDGHEKGIIFKMDSTKAHFKPYIKLEGFLDVYNKDIEMQLNKEKEE